MNLKQKRNLKFIIFITVLTAFNQPVYAMHIMEGFLPLGYCVFWGVLCLPFLYLGFIKIKKIIDNERRSLILLAMSGAFIFVISSLKIPSVTGSCSHMTGTGLGTILFGVPVTSILALIVLIFQALLLAHGGITTLGANDFSMGIAGPILTLFIYKLGQKFRVNNKFNIFLSCALGDLFTYCITSVQLALAYPAENGGFISSVLTFLGVFAPTQIPLAIIEGLLSVVLIVTLESYAKPELESIHFDYQR